MRIQENYVNFTSLNRPIKPSNIKVDREVLSFGEIDYNKPPTNELLEDIATFFLDNFANQSSHPFWKSCRKGTKTFDKKVYNNYINDLIANYNKILNNPDTTVMLGRNSNREICAGIVTTPLDILKGANTDRILYLDSLAVDKQYRKNHIAQRLTNDVEESSKGRFDEVFLVAYNESVPFYKKQGFVQTEDNEITEHFAKERKDYPEFASFLSKNLINN